MAHKLYMEGHSIWSHHFMRNRWRNNGNSVRLNFGGSKITVDDDCSHEIKMLTPWKESYDQPRQHIKKQTLLCQQTSVRI